MAVNNQWLLTAGITKFQPATMTSIKIVPESTEIESESLKILACTQTHSVESRYWWQFVSSGVVCILQDKN